MGDLAVLNAASALGVPLDADGAARLGPLVTRVLDGLAGHRGLPATDAVLLDTESSNTADGVDSSGRPADTGPWVWRPSRLVPNVDGPLAGKRLSVKDLIAVAGRPLRCGSAVRADAPIEAANAPIVDTFLNAGAHLVGTTKLHEFAFGVTGINQVDGTPANAVDSSRVPGGSSSGAAVVVGTGAADISIGTDTGGSVRGPAALNGVVGFKPSSGLLPTSGVFPLSPTLDHVGLFTSDARAMRTVTKALGIVSSTEPRRPRRVGVARSNVDAATEPVRGVIEAVLGALTRTGVELTNVEWPSGEEVFAATTAIMFAEATQVHRATLADRHGDYGPDVLSRLIQGAAFGIEDYLVARRTQQVVTARCLEILQHVDIVIGPTSPVMAPLVSEAADPAVAATIVANTRLANLTGLPAMSVPAPGAPLPVGLQIEGATDAAVIDAAVSFQAVFG